MECRLRPAVRDDEPFLWSMLFEAAHAADDGMTHPDELRAVPELARYVEGWGRPDDLGVVALAGPPGEAAVGAAWARLLTGDTPGYGYVDDDTPEVAIAVAPGRRAGGTGGRLLSALVAAARPRFPGLCLSVRSGNPARRLYEQAGFRPVPGRGVPNRSAGTSITMVLRF
ncbi:MAG TPA: GNAT family N-acetyltransferase [Acidimicrobiales bacterium]